MRTTGVIFKMLFITVWSVILFLGNSCTKDVAENPKETELTENYEKWKNNNISSYSYTETMNCFCVDRGPFQITITNKEITGVKNANNEPVAFAGKGFKTIDELFQFIETALSKNPHKATIVYNSQFGYPESIYIDYNENMADEEMGYSIQDFKK